MTGRLLIADDLFASRLTLAGLFTGAYYEVLMAENAETALAMARRHRPDAMLISDHLGRNGAADLCRRLREDPQTADCLRLVMAQGADAARTAHLFGAGADDVLPQGCSDLEMLARLRSLRRHGATMSELQMRGSGSGMAEGMGPGTAQPGTMAARNIGLAEDAAVFRVPARLALISGRLAEARLWARDLADALGPQISAPPVVLGCDQDLPDNCDVIAVDGATMATETCLRLVSSLVTAQSQKGVQLMLITPPEAQDLAAKALDLGVHAVVHSPFDAEDAAARVAALIRRKAMLDRLRKQLRNGMKSAMTDALTGLFNRRYILPFIDRLLTTPDQATKGGWIGNGAARGDAAGGVTGRLALLMVDLDHFKWINDSFGHAAGDQVLAAVGRAIQADLRPCDAAARIGGEEFVVVLPGCGAKVAAHAAEALRRRIEALDIPVQESAAPVKITASIGVAFCETGGARGPQYGAVRDYGEARGPELDHHAAQALMTKADQALYRAKAAGRNQVLSDPQPAVMTGAPTGTWDVAHIA